MEYFLYYQYAITALLALILLNFIINNILYKNVSKFILPLKTLKKGPLVSYYLKVKTWTTRKPNRIATLKNNNIFKFSDDKKI